MAGFGSPLLFKKTESIATEERRMKITHVVEFEDGSAAATGKLHDGITMNYSWEENEKLNVESIDV